MFIYQTTPKHPQIHINIVGTDTHTVPFRHTNCHCGYEFVKVKALGPRDMGTMIQFLNKFDFNCMLILIVFKAFRIFLNYFKIFILECHNLGRFYIFIK